MLVGFYELLRVFTISLHKHYRILIPYLVTHSMDSSNEDLSTNINIPNLKVACWKAFEATKAATNVAYNIVKLYGTTDLLPTVTKGNGNVLKAKKLFVNSWPCFRLSFWKILSTLWPILFETMEFYPITQRLIYIIRSA